MTSDQTPALSASEALAAAAERHIKLMHEVFDAEDLGCLELTNAVERFRSEPSLTLSLDEIDVLGDIASAALADEDIWGPGQRARAEAVSERLRTTWNAASRGARKAVLDAR